MDFSCKYLKDFRRRIVYIDEIARNGGVQIMVLLQKSAGSESPGCTVAGMVKNSVKSQVSLQAIDFAALHSSFSRLRRNKSGSSGHGKDVSLTALRGKSQLSHCSSGILPCYKDFR